MLTTLETLFHQLAEGRSLQEIITYASQEIFHNPIAVVNEAFRMLAIHANSSVDEPLFNDLLTNARISTERIAMFRQTPEVVRLYRERRPFIMDNGEAEKIHRIMTPIDFKGTTLGYLMIFEAESAFDENSLENAYLLMDTLRILLHKRENESSLQTDVEDYYLLQLLQGAHVPASAPHFSEGQRCVVFSINLPQHTDDADYTSMIRERLCSFADTIRCFRFENSIFAIFAYDSQAAYSVQLERIAALLKRFGCKAGVSTPFNDLAELRDHYDLAARLRYVGSIVDPKGTLYTCDDMHTFVAFSYLPERIARASQPLEFQQLKAYDTKHVSDLINTLQYYYACSMNINETARAMHVHRNTVAYRLSIISDKLGIDYNNMQLLVSLIHAAEYDRWLESTGSLLSSQ